MGGGVFHSIHFFPPLSIPSHSLQTWKHNLSGKPQTINCFLYIRKKIHNDISGFIDAMSIFQLLLINDAHAQK